MKMNDEQHRTRTTPVIWLVLILQVATMVFLASAYYWANAESRACRQQYTEQLKEYAAQNEQYEEAMAEYNQDKAQYDATVKQYEKDMEEYRRQFLPSGQTSLLRRICGVRSTTKPAQEPQKR